jgi:hypothetical protein
MIMTVHFIQGAIPNRSIILFLNEYTTVGSNFNRPLRWRLLEGMLATSGLLTFAWSTGILLKLAQEFPERHTTIFKQKQAGPEKLAR